MLTEPLETLNLGEEFMKKTIITGAILAMSSFGAQAQQCVIELQFEGSVLGQNTFVANNCMQAMRDCKRTQKTYERRFSFSENDLSCVRLGDIGPGNGNGPGNGPGNGGYYTNLDALTDLENMENDNNQARDVYNLILSYVDRRVVDLKIAVDLYEQILMSNGGANSTDASKVVLIMLLNESEATGLAPMVLADAYTRMVNAENDDEQAKENLRIVLREAQANGVDPILALDAFTAMLESSGPNATDDVRNVFTRFITIRRVSIDKAIRDYTIIANLENSADDAMSNYELVLEAARTPSIRYRDAFSTMVELLERYGANSTSDVQRRFRDVFRI